MLFGHPGPKKLKDQVIDPKTSHQDSKFGRKEREVKGPNYWTGEDWADIFDDLYMKAVSMEDTMALREALASAHDAEFPKIRKPRANCPALIKACLIVSWIS